MTNNITKYFIFLLLIAGGLFIGCKKNPLDARSKYVGTWNFTYTYSTYSAGQTTSSTYVEYTGSVAIDAASKYSIYINWGPNLKCYCPMIAKLFKDKAELNGGTGELSGQFNNKNSADFHLYSGGMGSGYTYEIHGTKK